MAALALGKAAVTTEGRLADRIWAETGCVELSSQASAELVQRIRGLLSDPSRRRALEQRARATYAEHFAIEHTVQKLRAAAARFV
jgi:glycosyltransferase involved in cell wall biosynthesis